MSDKFISSVWQFNDSNYEKVHNIFRWYGKLPPQLVNKLINLYSIEGDKILANFGGSGTILIESIINGRYCESYDINPTALLIENTKLNYIDSNIEEIIQFIDNKINSENIDFSNTFSEYEKKWFELGTLNTILKIKHIIKTYYTELNINSFLLFSLISIIRKCSLVDNRCINHIVVDKNKKITNPLDEFFTTIRENYHLINEFTNKYKDSISLGKCSFGDARNIKSPDDYYDLVISHPPYLGNVNYSNINQLQNYILDFSYSKTKEKDLSTESLKIYLENMYQVIDEMIRVVKKGKKICLIIGDSRKKGDIIPTFSYFIQYGINKGLKFKDTFIWVLQGKAGNSIKRHGNHIDHNYILVFEK